MCRSYAYGRSSSTFRETSLPNNSNHCVLYDPNCKLMQVFSNCGFRTLYYCTVCCNSDGDAVSNPTFSTAHLITFSPAMLREGIVFINFHFVRVFVCLSVYVKQEAPLPRRAQRVRRAYSWCSLLYDISRTKIC